QQSARERDEHARESPGERVARAFAVGKEHGRRARAHTDDARAKGRVPVESEDGAHLFGVQPVLEALRAGARPVERVTVGAGAHGIFVPERRASGLTETVAKSAAGALEYVRVARAVNIARLVEELKGRGVWTVGTASEASTTYTEWDWTQPCALLLGGEGEGLRRLVRERCDALVH